MEIVPRNSWWKWISLLLVFALLLVYLFGTTDHEIESTKLRQAKCEIFQIGELLNQEFSSQQKYPSVSGFVIVVENNRDKFRCGRQIMISESVVLDPWGEEYCYGEGAPNSVFVYSTSAVIPALGETPETITYLELRGGQTNKVELPWRGKSSCQSLLESAEK